jgi:hypothetical protein
MAASGKKQKQLKGGKSKDTFDHSFTAEVWSTLGWCAGFAATGLFTVSAGGAATAGAAATLGGIGAITLIPLLECLAVLAVGVGFFYLAAVERKRDEAEKEAEKEDQEVKVQLAQGQKTVTINLETPKMDYSADQAPVGKFTSAVQAERDQPPNIGAYVS